MANQTITQLPDAGPITGTELVPIVQNGGTYKTTTAAISASPSQTQTFLTQSQELTLPNSRYLSTGTGLGLTDGGATAFYRISLNGASGSLEAASAGIVVKNSSTTVIARTLTTSGNGISVSNGDGTGGNPTFQLTGIAAAIANMGGTGMLAIVGGTSIAGRQIVGTTNQIAVTNGNGSGNPTISIADNVVLPGTGAMTIPSGTAAQQPVGSPGQFRFNSDTSTFDGFANGTWAPFSLGAGVSSFSAGSTGFTPATNASGAVTLGGVLNAANGGTGASSLTGYVKGNGTAAMTASTSIPSSDVSGLGTMSTQNANAVAITGGTVSGVAATGGSINNTPIGASSAAAGTFTSITATTGTIATTPTSATDIANKSYVDGLVTQGISYHNPVYVESPNTAGNLNATYNNGAAGVGATLTNAGAQAALTIDGVLTTVGMRVLVYNQTNQAENGIYTVTTVGSGSTNWVLTRATDANTYGIRDPNALGYNDAFFVQAGNTGAGETYVCTTTGVITFGVTAITFSQISASVTYSAGTGLNLSPSTTFNISNTGVTAASYGSASQVPVFAVNAQGQLTGVNNTSIAIAAGAVSGLAASATTDTTNAANITSGTLPTARLSGSYTGITAVGTLTAGTWNATAIGVAYGGTGLTATPTNGQLAIGNGTGYSLATLTAGTNVSITNSAGGITINATPAAGGTVTSVSGSGGTTGLTLTGGPITVSGTLTLGGTLVPANGGTGAATLTGYVYGNGTSTMTASTTIPNTAITGLGTMSTQAASAVAITGGTIDGTSVGATTASTVRGTTITATTQFSGPGTGLTGTASSLTIGGNAANVTGTVAIANGGTGQTTQQAALNALSGTQTANRVLRSNGTNVTFSQVALATDVSGTLPVSNGGTGATTLTANNVLLGNGTAALQVVAPSTSGNVLTSNGTTWQSTAPAVTASSTTTFTNKRITPRVVSIADAPTITPTGDTADQYVVTALAQAATIAAPSGTPTDGQKLTIRIEDNGTGRALTWTITSGAYRAIGVTLPTTTTASKTLYVGCIYNSQDTFWDVVAVAQQA